MQLVKQESYPINVQQDVVIVRQKVRLYAVEAGFSVVDQTKVITAASELARNILDYGGGGQMKLSLVKNDRNKPGVQLVFEDQGPGIEDIELALTDGYTTGGGLGMGLSGSKRLMNEFNLETEKGKGTRVTVTKWK